MKLYVILSILLLVGFAHGQMRTPQPGSPSAAAAMYGGVPAGVGAPNIPGAPFSADTVSQSSHVQPNGDPVRHEMQGKLYRDSQGRTRREADILSGSGTVAGRNVVITDPLQHLTIILNANDKIARLYHSGPSPAAGVYGPAATASANLPPQRTMNGQPVNVVGATIQPRPNSTLTLAPAPAAASGSMSVKSDSLGEKELQGILVTGTKITRTTIAGAAAGNPQTTVSTTENWVSPELKVAVLTEIDDSRGNQTVMKLTNIQRAEPDASLFQVPPEYTVVDIAKK